MHYDGRIKESCLEREREAEIQARLARYANRTGPGFEDRYHNGRLKESYKEMVRLRAERALASPEPE